MCGIAGFAGTGDEATLGAMAARLKHRGPDASGTWISEKGRAGLAHTRLSIIDLSLAAKQPMESADGRYHIVFNGEIYNFAELRKELSSYPFKTHSDTEVILAAYAAWGAGGFERLRGMFAFALYDSRAQELILARDRLGKKPLYWSKTASGFIFGSELKALRAHPGCPREIDLRSAAHYFAREYVPTPRSIYKDMRKLEPGSYLRLKEGMVTIKPYWNPSAPAESMSEAEALARLDALLTEATRERMVSDVPLGVFLSGGIDSSTVAYFASNASAQKIKTFSIGFSEKSFDESAQARLVAKRLGTEHYEKVLDGTEALALVGRLPQVLDEPLADASILPTLLLSQFTREHVTVALGGDGADELLLGYPTFKAERYAQAYGRVPRSVRSALRAASDLLPHSLGYMSLGFKARKFTHDFSDDAGARHLQWLGSFREDELEALLSPEAAAQARDITGELAAQWHAECPELGGLNELSHLYMRTYLMDQVLVKVDRASMAHSLEVRAPFLSHDIAEFLLALPPELKYKNGRGKRLLRALMRGRLPDGILDRPKQGFAAPVAGWLRRELKDLATDALAEGNIKKSGLLSPAEVTRLLQEHLSGRRNHGKKLWTLLTFQLWYDTWQAR
jgi:asparagine synthase (glutamine-hydrolysing)